MVYGYGDAQQPASVVLCGARGLRLGLLGAAAKWLVTPAQPHQRLVPGALIRAAQGARSPTGAYAGKDCGFGWFVVSHVVLVERLVVDALW